MNKKCADARWFLGGIELGIVTARLMIASKKRFAFTPAAAADQFAVGFDNEVRRIANQLSIYAKDGAERALNLCDGIIIRA